MYLRVKYFIWSRNGLSHLDKEKYTHTASKWEKCLQLDQFFLPKLLPKESGLARTL